MLCELVPDFQPSPKGGRPPVSKRDALAGIFWGLGNGAKWKDLPKSFGSKSSVHRWFTRWVKDGVFEKILHALGRFVDEEGRFRLYECFVSPKPRVAGMASVAPRPEKESKSLSLWTPKGLPVAVSTCSASPHESRLIQELFGFMLTKELPARVIGDKAYDSDPLDAALACKGIEMIAPNRCNRTQTQDGRPLRRYRRRWTVERTIAWLKNYRRLCIRWENSNSLSKAFFISLDLSS
jgi:transposase